MLRFLIVSYVSVVVLGSASLLGCSGSKFEEVKRDALPNTAGTAGVDPDTSNGGAGASGAPCEPGAFSCQGAALLRCDESGQALLTVEVCASEALCDSAKEQCTAPSCDPGDHRCNGAILEECDDARTGWALVATCRSEAHCNASEAACSSEPCLAGTLMCSGTDLQSCKADRSGWETTVGGQCLTPALCNLELAKCDDSLCEPGDSQCFGAEWQACSGGQDAWETIATCADEALCQPDVGCLPAVCDVDAFVCEGEKLMRCTTDQAGYELSDTCKSSGHCNASLGKCDAPCTAGIVACNGATLRTCSDDQKDWLPIDPPCETAALCDATLAECVQPECVPAQCKAPVCVLNEYYCNGPQLQVCNAGRTGWDDVGSPCASAALCDAPTLACIPPTCEQDEYQCDGAQLRVCNADLTGWDDVAACESPELCELGLPEKKCEDPGCTATWFQCRGAQLWECNDAVTAWEYRKTCTANQYCQADANAQDCIDYECAPDEYVCDDENKLRVCNGNRDGYDYIATCNGRITLELESADGWDEIEEATDGNTLSTANYPASIATVVYTLSGGERHVRRIRARQNGGFTSFSVYSVARGPDELLGSATTEEDNWVEFTLADPVLATTLSFTFENIGDEVGVQEIQAYATEGTTCNEEAGACE